MNKPLRPAETWTKPAGAAVLYIAGPMRGIPQYNFPAFEKARESLQKKDYKVLCPANMDLKEGFDPNTPECELTTLDMERFLKRDIDMIAESDGIVLLEGWELSIGVNAEIAVAQFLNKPIYLYPELNEFDPKDIWHDSDDVLVEALELTSGDRQNQYGAPDQDFARTAKMWSALKGVEFTTEEVAAFQICIKLSRNTHQSKRDNWVDIAGYARCGHICQKCKEARNASNIESS